MRKIFAPAKNSASANFALLVLRFWIGLEMLVVHGVEKLVNFQSTSAEFPDPIGVGSTVSLALVVFAEVVCSLFIILGLLTRGCALVLMINMSVAFFMVHKGALSGPHSDELALVYLMAYFVLFLAGPGRVSADRIFFGKNPAVQPH
jgi:putative oxidoreductase